MPGSVQIQRSNDDLQVTCNKPGLEAGRASVVSIVKPGMVGNFFFGGIIGVAIDHSSGAAYDYPNMIQVMMGQMTKIGYTEGHATTHTTTNPAGGPPGVDTNKRLTRRRDPNTPSQPNRHHDD